MAADEDDDIRAIQALLARQFASLSWTTERDAHWSGFVGDFHGDASLWPSARPAKPVTADAFLERMQGLAKTSLRSFEETLLGTEVRVFGHVAVATAACEMVENGAERSRNVEMALLVKEEGRWRIVAQAWDKEGPGRPIPPELGG